MSSLKPRLLSSAGLILIAASVFALFGPLVFAGGNNKSSKKTTSTDTGGEQQKLTGQELYAIHCSRCHSERYPTEWTPSHWRTVMMHMRVRANLPADQAKEILKYLEQDAGN